MAGGGSSEFSLEREGPVLPWDRFRKWVTCFCVVTFDIELGQAIEVGIARFFFLLCSMT